MWRFIYVGLFSQAASERTRQQQPQAAEIQLEIRRNFFMERIVKLQNRLPREMLKLPSLEVFQKLLDMALRAVMVMAQRLDWTLLETFSNRNDSVIPCYITQRVSQSLGLNSSQCPCAPVKFYLPRPCQDVPWLVLSCRMPCRNTVERIFTEHLLPNLYITLPVCWW